MGHHWRVVRLLVALLFASVACTACSSTATTSVSASTSTSTSTTVLTHSAASAAPPPLTTTTSTLDLVDTSRPVISNGVELATTRQLPTTLVSPATTGPWPLVVFVHGYGVGPSTYQRYLGQLASRGFVVAAPSFPLEDPARGFPLDRSHLTDEAADVSFVISQIEASAARLDVRPGRIGVVGHSDGADVALLVGYDALARDQRIEAVVADAPDPITSAIISGGAPVLLVQGTADEIVAPGSARAVFNQLSAQRWLVELDGANHAGPILGPSPWTATFDTATDDFLLAVLDRTGTRSLTSTFAGLRGVAVQAAPGP